MLNMLLTAALIATAITVFIGVLEMVKGSQYNRKNKSNKMMQLRVFFQTLALIILTFLLLFQR